MSNENSEEQILSEIADVIIEELSERVQEDEELLESYLFSVKMRVYSEKNLFKSNFVKGYAILNQTLD